MIAVFLNNLDYWLTVNWYKFEFLINQINFQRNNYWLSRDNVIQPLKALNVKFEPKTSNVISIRSLISIKFILINLWSKIWIVYCTSYLSCYVSGEKIVRNFRRTNLIDVVLAFKRNRSSKRRLIRLKWGVINF